VQSGQFPENGTAWALQGTRPVASEPERSFVPENPE